mmetsp:Transcript_4013/g.5886  ORF Transcript_4013/g.5886 Transcript_4013/m.5886 type:complete len:215 (-) Transcript_4013:556-1200(-)|eukprot:CAMPEP_0194588700 /NCGR_PEP_ID=MMETSP0292-20121207/20017_1 /TAXON_ID=39354 /ORGANISM="Heterosigma akashiwo, Strain CCMP2393" /LENGTH=214 /DNA_ID=CAMNT_0039445415 /DNA_START=67 /DNA_END=711 /DNA_ORIENTATION=-
MNRFACLVVLSIFSLCAGFSSLGVAPSKFAGGNRLVSHEVVHKSRNGVASLQAKKGKPNRGGQMYPGMQNRGVGGAPSDAAMMNKEMLKDGFPVFQVFVRSKVSKIWYPAAALKGDQQAQALVNAYMSGFLEDLYKSQLETGISKSVLSQKASLAAQVKNTVPPLKKVNVNDMEFGFKVLYEGLEEKKGPQKVQLITEDMSLGLFDKFKKNIGL